MIFFLRSSDRTSCCFKMFWVRRLNKTFGNKFSYQIEEWRWPERDRSHICKVFLFWKLPVLFRRIKTTALETATRSCEWLISNWYIENASPMVANEQYSTLVIFHFVQKFAHKMCRTQTLLAHKRVLLNKFLTCFIDADGMLLATTAKTYELILKAVDTGGWYKKIIQEGDKEP